MLKEKEGKKKLDIYSQSYNHRCQNPNRNRSLGKMDLGQHDNAQTGDLLYRFTVMARSGQCSSKSKGITVELYCISTRIILMRRYRDLV